MLFGITPVLLVLCSLRTMKMTSIIMKIVTPLNLGTVIFIAKLSKIIMMIIVMLMLMLMLMLMPMLTLMLRLRMMVMVLMLMLLLVMMLLMLMTRVSPLTARNLPIRGSSGHTVHCQGDGIETMMMKSAQEIHVKFR